MSDPEVSRFSMNIPSQKSRVILITGATAGIGQVTARRLAEAGAHLFLACRSEEKAQKTIEEIKAHCRQKDCPNEQIEFLRLDLGSFESVRACAAEFLARDLPLHVLINNAGLGGIRGITPEGFELQFGVNHLGHFLLTALLAERLEESAPARVVTVASEAHYLPKKLDLDALQRSTKTYTGFPEYSVSKLANVLFSAELARRFEGSGVHTYALHPGVVASDIWKRIPWPFRSIAKRFMLSEEDGARTTLYCATSPEVAEDTGLFYDSCRKKKPARLARDPQLAAELWARSEEWTGAEFSGYRERSDLLLHT
jgi:NAD(P)-dependent dehydrogenase (short-subunit alcohol dehydrogenase family)